MLYTIYRVTHEESGKTYIGKHQTLDPNDGYLGSGQMIRRAVKKHGLSAFRKEVLHVFETESEMNAKEIELVTEEFCARDDTYNLCPGGQGGWGYVNTLERSSSWRVPRKVDRTPEYRANASLAQKKKYEAGYQNPRKGIPFPEALNNKHAAGKWITNGITDKKLKTEDLPEGWTFGRSVKPWNKHAAVV